MIDAQNLTLTESLRINTKEAHEKLDHYLTNLGLFNNIQLYKKFLALQYYIHHNASNYYNNHSLKNIIPDLTERNHFEKIKEDLNDLKMEIPNLITPLPEDIDPSEAVGFIYVIEGSKLGANTLLKRIKKIGLSETFGARHMKPDPEGRGASWKKFQDAINNAKLDIHTTLKSATITFNQILAYAKFVTT